MNGKLDEEQENDWLDLLERFDCKTVPKAKQVKDVVLCLQKYSLKGVGTSGKFDLYFR